LVEKTLTKDNLEIFTDKVDDFDGIGVVVDDAAYDTGIFKDREYDVRAFKGVSIDIENVGANSIDFVLLGTTKDFNKISDLVNADYYITVTTQAPLAAAARATVLDVEYITPRFTALKLRCKETIAANSGTVRGDVRAR